jgi:tetratricopeptide (TPR) repeat protein
MLKRYRFGGPREAVVAADAPDLSGQISELLALADGLAAQGRSAEARDIYLALSQVAPGDVRILKPLGILFATEQAWAQAAERLAAAIALPGGGDALVHNVLSVCRYELGDPAAALAHAEQALLRNPRFAAAHNNRGNALNRLGRPAEALEACDAALRLEPRDPIFLVNRANALRDLGRTAEALEALDLALAIAAAIPAAHSNRGDVLHDLGRLEAAIEAYDRALALDPACPGARFGRGLCKLTLGCWDEGWADYEARFTDAGGVIPRRAVPAPLWLGQDSVAGKSVLLHAEQGLGDAIQFVRYATAVAGLGARVRLRVHSPLVELLSQIDGVSEVLPLEEPAPAVDAHCPLMSLPLALARAGAPLQTPSPYLAAAPHRIDAWRRRLRGKAGLNIGLVCSGSPTHSNDANRSLPLDLLEQALPVGPAYHLLQKEIRPRDLAALARRSDIHALGEAFADFVDTAAACAAMDLVVSVDTSVAHVSGALGRPTWVLLPARGDWRWGLEGDRTPWYPSFRLYRAGPEGWAETLAALRRDLEALCS